MMCLFINLLNFCFLFFFGKFLNKIYSCLFVNINLAVNLLLLLYNYYFILYNNYTINVNFYNWIISNNLKIEFMFTFDNLIMLMLIIVISISLMVHIYSSEYMLYDPEQIKFLSFLSLFTSSMILLLISNNFILFFMGWELVGISSYLLINFWYSRLTANKSALLAVFINKIGDISLLLSFGYIYLNIFTLDINILILTLISNLLNKNDFYLIAFFFIIGAVGKSAQIGLHLWLPEAMEGPTPVSSLIHAATMVTAGVFLLIKMNIIFIYLNNICILIVGFGSITTFLASSIGLFQYDIKKIIAYSTCSQLGYMFFVNGLNGFNYSLYHLINHAFFKALLFLIAGYIIHAFNNEQDIRKLSGQLEILPFAYISLLVSNLALIGFPFLSGFYSKEKIIELYLNIYNIYENFNIYIINYLLFFQFLSNISIIFTIYYSIKMLVILFFIKFNNNINTINNIYFSSIITIYPLFFLNILSIFSGYFLQDLIIGINHFNWYNILFILNNNIIYYEFINKTNIYTFLTVLYFIFIFFFINLKDYYDIKNNNININNLNIFLQKKYIFMYKNIFFFIIDKFYNFAFKYIYKLFDKGFLELFGSYGINKLIIYFNNKISNLNLYLIYYNSIIILLWLLFILFDFYFINNIDLIKINELNNFYFIKQLEFYNNIISYIEKNYEKI